MTEENVTEATETAEATEEKATKRAPVDPFAKEPTATHRSLAKYVSDNSPVELSPEQAQAVLVLHSKWQSSDERKAEREIEKAEAAKEAEAKKAEREAAKAKREAEKEAKAKEKAAKEAAKKAAEEGSDSDLDAEPDDEAPAEGGRPKRRRRAAATAE